LKSAACIKIARTLMLLSLWRHLRFATEKGRADDGVEGKDRVDDGVEEKDRAEKNQSASCSQAKNEEGERRRTVNEETRTFYFRFESLET
jgi:hypothetical protein